MVHADPPRLVVERTVDLSLVNPSLVARVASFLYRPAQHGTNAIWRRRPSSTPGLRLTEEASHKFHNILACQTLNLTFRIAQSLDVLLGERGSNHMLEGLKLRSYKMRLIQ